MSVQTVHPAADLFPLMEGDEFDELVADIQANGLIEPVWYTPDGLLLDGRNRVRACGEAGVRIESRTYEGDDPIGFVLSLNLQRRHLTEPQRVVVGLDALPLRQAEARERMSKGGSSRKGAPTGAPLPATPRRAADDVAEEVGVSSRTMQRGKRVQDFDKEHGTDLVEQMRSGAIQSVASAEKQVKRRRAQIEEQAAREITIDTVLSPDAEGDGWKMMHGDFREQLAKLPDGSVDLIVTDPPYPAEFLPLYSDLSKHAARVLTHQGILVCLTGQIFLPEVLQRLGENLSYGWIYVQPLPGQNSTIMGRHINQTWKPWVAYSNGPWPSGRVDWHPDTLDPSVRAKGQYRWQQDGTPAQHLIVELCPEGGTVLDPFTGTGSYGLATRAEGRRFIGIEEDHERYDMAVAKLGENG